VRTRPKAARLGQGGLKIKSSAMYPQKKIILFLCALNEQLNRFEAHKAEESLQPR
jgi:hypothetical protein